MIRATSWYTPVPRASDTLVRGLCDRPGPLTAAGRVRRERARLQAAQMFEHDVSPVEVAHDLRVSTKSQDQRWTLARVATLIGRLFHVRYTPRGVSYLPHRLGYAPQVPIHRAAGRDEAKIAAWCAVTWAKVRG